MLGGLSVIEILIVLIIVLVIFGPRKLPQFGKTLGQSLAQFRKASEDFKQGWENEVTIEEKRAEVAPVTPGLTPPAEGNPKTTDGDTSPATI